MTINWTLDRNGCPNAEHEGWAAHVIDYDGLRTAELDGPNGESAHMDGTVGRLLVYDPAAIPLPLLLACIEKLRKPLTPEARLDHIHSRWDPLLARLDDKEVKP